MSQSFKEVGGYLREEGAPEGRTEWRRDVVPAGSPNDRIPGIARLSRPAGGGFVGC